MLKRIIYISGMCSEKEFEHWFQKAKNKPGQQIQKYHRTMAAGLVNLKKTDVKVWSKIPLSWKDYKFLFKKGYPEYWRGIQVKYLPMVTIPVMNHIFYWFLGYFSILGLNASGDTVVILDILNVSLSMGAIKACQEKHIKTIGIITDLPEMLVPNEKAIYVKACKKIIEGCSGFLLLTEAMNDSVNKERRKPYTIIEGQADSSMAYLKNIMENKYKKKVCLYSGSLNKVNGIAFMVNGFLNAEIPDSELHLYGEGDYVDDLLKICSENKNVKYFGVKMNKEIIQEQMKATLLINPRPTNQEFVKYSFPSKIMEYMASGTPVLTTCLPAMPSAYYAHVYLLKEETPKGMAGALIKILQKPEEELYKKGKKAKEFILNNKNETRQAEKLYQLAKRLTEE